MNYDNQQQSPPPPPKQAYGVEPMAGGPIGQADGIQHQYQAQPQPQNSFQSGYQGGYQGGVGHQNSFPPNGQNSFPPSGQNSFPPGGYEHNGHHHGPPGAESEWESGLCNCSPCESCLLGTCLPCILLGRTSERMRDPSMRTYERFNQDCLLMFGITYFTCCGWIYIMMKRGEIRERFNIKGSGLGDCCTTFWCGCCALIQQDNEVKRRTGTADGPDTRGYQPNKEGMTMQPQRPN